MFSSYVDLGISEFSIIVAIEIIAVIIDRLVTDSKDHSVRYSND